MIFMVKANVIFTIEDLNTLQTNDRKKFLKTVIAAAFITNRKNVTPRQFDNYFIDNGVLLLDNCRIEFSDTTKAPINLCVDKNTEKTTYDRLKQFLTNDLANEKDFDIVLQCRAKNKTSVLTADNIRNIYETITENPINYLYYQEICHYVRRKIKKQEDINKLVSKKCIIDIKIDNITNELDLIGCILFLEKSKKNNMNVVVFNIITSTTDDSMRVRTFLNLLCKNYHILLNGKQIISSELPYKNLSPCYFFVQEETTASNVFHYKAFSKPINSNIISEDIFDDFIRFEAERIWNSHLCGKLPEALHENEFIQKKIMSFNFNNFEKTIASQIWRNFQNCIECRENELKTNLNTLFTSVKSAENKNDELLKERTILEIAGTLKEDKIIANIINVVIEFAQKSSPSFSSVLLFQFLSVFLTEDMSLGIDLNDDKNGDEVKSILRRIYLNICSFSEGIFQLIENTCIHSSTHCGFLSTKLYPTSLLESKSMPKLIKSAQNVDKLNSKYKTCPENTDDPFGARYHMEIRINDISDSGIVDTYFEKHKGAFITKSNLTLKDFFEDTNSIIKAINPNNQERKDIVINHYGLRLLNRIIKVNNGDFTVTSIGADTEDIYSLNKSKIEKQTYGTEYSILLPLSLHSYENFSDSIRNSFEKNQLFSMQAKINSLINVCPDKIDSSKEKMDNISDICTSITKSLGNMILNNSDSDLGEHIVCIDLEKYNVSEIELAAKALIQVIAEIYFNNKNSEKTHIANFALLFGDNCELKIYEFVRVFSIFYTKSNMFDSNTAKAKNKNDGINEWMHGVQIALCSSDNYINNKKFNAVNFVIAGSNIESARLTALSYAYYNSSISLKYISAVRYFTRIQGNTKATNNGKKSEIPSLVPFDLFLSNSEPNKKDISINTNNSWFIEQIKSVINTPIQNTQYGCKNEKIHIKIGSKIHIGDFYEAELLFHNIANIEKFAFLLASKIIQQNSDKKRNILLIGYESYSESLILKIKDSLAMHPNIGKVSYSIYYKECTENGYNEALTNLENIENILTKDPEIVSVMPIGTTLSTVHKIKNVLTRKFSNDIANKINLKWQQSKHFVIVAIRDSTKKDNENISLQESKYWQKIENNIIFLKDENLSNNKTGIQVQYLIEVFTVWQDASKCEYCRLDKENEYAPIDYIDAPILVDVDKTSTIPCSIFRLKKNNKSGYNSLCSENSDSMLTDVQNAARFEQLKDCIIYSHIYINHNHFQYYFDTQKYYMKIKNNKDKNIEAKNWLKQIEKKLRSKTDNAFNIIVSPLKQTNSEFLNDVEKYVFNHNIRFLHFTLEDSFREEIRAKFSYIAEEYKRIKKINRNNKINIFFVDDVITTGKTFQRARNYIRMLLNESEVFDNTQNVFDGVIILLNRNSYDSICNYVSNPNEDLFAYVHVAISAIKASSGSCPLCRATEQFQLLKKRSAENDMRMEFARLVNKQKKRTVEEYKKWLDNEIEYRHGYFSWLKQWIYVYSNDVDKDDICKVKDFIKKMHELLFNASDDYAQTIDFWNSLSLAKLKYIFAPNKVSDINEDILIFGKKYDKQIKFLKTTYKNDNTLSLIDSCKLLIKKYAIPQRDYFRALCSHKITLTTENIFKKLNSDSVREDINNQTVNALLELFNSDCGCHKDISKFNTCNDILTEHTDNDIITSAKKIDLLISYIKISSRPFPARYHNIEQAIYRIITAFCVTMLEESSKIGNIIEQIAKKVVPSEDAESEKYRIMFINIAKIFIDFKNIGINANISPVHQLELFRVMMNRLGIMQSNFVTNQLVLHKIFDDNYGVLNETRNIHDELIKKNADYFMYCEFPEDEWLIFAYRRMIMRLSMLSDNDSINIALDRCLLNKMSAEERKNAE